MYEHQKKIIMEDLCYIIGYYIYVQLHVRTSKEINKLIMEDLNKMFTMRH